MNTADASKSDSSPSEQRPSEDQSEQAKSLIIESRDLFQGNSVIQIRHGNKIYTLRQTRLGKLILNK